MELVALSVRFRWSVVGMLVLQPDGQLLLPRLPRRAGLYRFLLSHTDGAQSVYIGEAENLRRRMNHYRNPGPSQQTNMRLNALIRSHLGQAGTTELAVAEDIEQLVDHHWVTLDLGLRPARLFAENAALLVALNAGVAVDNA